MLHQVMTNGLKHVCGCCVAMAVLNGCGPGMDDTSMPTGTDASSGTTGGGGSGGSAPWGMPFFPEGIQLEYVGKGPTNGLEIIAFTLQGDDEGPLSTPFKELYLAVKASGPHPICLVDVPAQFLDASGIEIASTAGVGALASPAYKSYGKSLPCLGSGDIGMGRVLVEVEASKIAKIAYGFVGAINPDAVKLTGVSVMDTKLEPAFTLSVRASGKVVNDGATSVMNPKVQIYAVDPAGRPYGEMSAFGQTTISQGSSWSFETTSILGPVGQYVSYVEYDVP